MSGLSVAEYVVGGRLRSDVCSRHRPSYGHIYTHIHTHTHTHTHRQTYTQTDTHTHTDIHTHRQTSYTQTDIHTHRHTDTCEKIKERFDFFRKKVYPAAQECPPHRGERFTCAPTGGRTYHRDTPRGPGACIHFPERDGFWGSMVSMKSFFTTLFV